MSIHYQDDRVTLHHGDCLDVLATLPDNSVDSVVTDPPYGLSNTDPGHVVEALTRWVNGERDYLPSGAGFMGKAWDAFVPPPAVWDECFRVLKPGGHLLVFAGTRTQDLMGLSIRLAGFDIRDSIAWLYANGFPKSLDVSKAIDKLDAAHERRERALRFTAWMRSTGITSRQVDEATGTKMSGHYLTAESQPAVATVAHLDMLRPLLPAVPEWVEAMCRQRTVESRNYAAREVVGQAKVIDTSRSRLGFTGETYGGDSSSRVVDLTTAHTPDAQRWQGWGTALKPAHEPVIVARKPLDGTVAANVARWGTGALNIDGCRIDSSAADKAAINAKHAGMNAATYQRPAGHSLNLSTNPMPLKPAAAHAGGRWPANVILDEDQARALDEQSGHQRDGVAVNRNKDPHAEKPHEVYGGGRLNGERPDATYGGTGGASRFFFCAKADANERPKVAGVAHPTVKPLTLMRHLVRLVTPPGGTVYEPFPGSGTTVEACLLERFRCIASEKEAEYLPLILARIHRQRDPVEAIKLAGGDLGLFDGLYDQGAS